MTTRDHVLVRLQLLGVVLMLAGLVACAASTRQKTLNATLASTDVASSTFSTWDRTHQLQLVNMAPDEASGKAALAKYRIEQAKVVLAVTGLYRLIAVAAIANDDHSLAAVVTAAGLLMQELRDLKVIK